MLNASIRALDGKGEPPSQDEAQQVKRLRASADDLFRLVMAQMGEMARNGGRLHAPVMPTAHAKLSARP